MSATGLAVFDTTLQKTNGWLKDLMHELGGDDRHKAYLALRATRHALRDRLTVEEVAQLGAQLPMLIRGFYYEGWDPTGKPLRERHEGQFRITDGEIEDVKHVLPAELRELRPADASGAARWPAA